LINSLFYGTINNNFTTMPEQKSEKFILSPEQSSRLPDKVLGEESLEAGGQTFLPTAENASDINAVENGDFSDKPDHTQETIHSLDLSASAEPSTNVNALLDKLGSPEGTAEILNADGFGDEDPADIVAALEILGAKDQ
jgi:hypothetical protein